MNKKAQGVAGIGGFVLSIVSVGIIIAISLIIMGQLRDSACDTGTSISITNESVAWGTNNTVKGWRNATDACSLTMTTVYNNSNHTQTITASVANYIYTTQGIKFNDTDTYNNNGTIYVKYNYIPSDDAVNATGVVMNKISTAPTWIGIIITVAMAFIVLGYFFVKRT